MKKLISLFLIICLPFFFMSCEKDKEVKQNEVTIVDHGNLKIGVTWSFTFKAGHNIAQCGGTCARCGGFGVPMVPCHLPCWGNGNLCTHTFTVNISLFNDGSGVGTAPAKIEFNKVYEGGVILNEDESNGELSMPSRSSFDKDKGYWINIPEQILMNTGDNMNFKLTKGVIFTKNKPMFNNEN